MSTILSTAWLTVVHHLLTILAEPCQQDSTVDETMCVLTVA